MRREARAARQGLQQPRRASTGAPRQLNHQLNFANWPYYIDTSHGTHPTLDTFKQQTGIQVNYKPVINDNQAFYAKI